MESLKNLISLFDSEKFFFMTTFLPVMLYKDFSETQRISIFYIIFWSFPTYQKYTKNAQSIPVVYIIMLFIIITFLSLEILTFDVPKLSLITNIMYKIIDYIFIMFSQYGVIYMILSIVILEIRNEVTMIFSIFLILNGLIKLFYTKEILIKIFNLIPKKTREMFNSIPKKSIVANIFWYTIKLVCSMSIYHNIIINRNILFIFSISLFVIGILRISCEDFKIKTVTELFKYFPPPVKTDENIFPLKCIYDINFFEWMDDKSDKEKNYEYYQILYEFLDKKKSKLFKWLKINHMEMSLVRSLGIWYGRENLIRLYFFSVIYTVFYTRSLRKFFEKRYGAYYSDKDYFKIYLLKICMRRLTLNFSKKVRYSSICNYMGERKENWSKEKFFVGCMGLENNKIEKHLEEIEDKIQKNNFIVEIIDDLNTQSVKKYNISKDKVKEEIFIFEIINDTKYSEIIKQYNLSETEIERQLRKIVSNE